MNKKPYNREKTLAIVTGLVCVLIFLCGTTLGGIHSLMALGGFGILSVACYLIADSAIAWAAYVDYHEDGNAVEWAAWIVKYLLSAYLLFSGGCIAWLMMMERGTESAQTSRSELYQKAYDDCMSKPGANGKPPRSRDCTQHAKGLLGNETELNKKETAEKNTAAGFVKTYVDWPLFKYLPGLLGLAGLFALTLVSKLVPQEDKTSEVSSEVGQNFRRNFRSSEARPVGNFRTSSKVPERYFRSDGGDFVRLQRVSTGARVIGKDGAHLGWVTLRKLERLEERGITYEELMKAKVLRKENDETNRT